MQNAKLIRCANVPGFKKGVRRERFYKLSPKGLSVVLDENPSPARILDGNDMVMHVNAKAVDKDEFNRYYDRFIQKSVGSFPFIVASFWAISLIVYLKKSGVKNYLVINMMISLEHMATTTITNNNNNKLPKTTQDHKVLECLLLNRQITIENIASLTQLPEKEIRKILNEYIITQSSNSYSNYANLFESAYQSDKSIGVTLDFLNHLVVIPIKKDEGQEKIQKAGEDSHAAQLKNTNSHCWVSC